MKNYWLDLSLEFANQKNYLDELFRVYPLVSNKLRDVGLVVWQDFLGTVKNAKQATTGHGQASKSWICTYLDDVCSKDLRHGCFEPKEINRQTGMMFQHWIQKGALGVLPLDWKRFHKSRQDSVMIGSDADFKDYAAQYLGYRSDKGLDLICRFNGKIIVGKAKFLTGWGKNQNNQLAAVQHFLAADLGNAVKVGIIDGVPYIPSNNKVHNKMHKLLIDKLAKQNVMSALVLREYLYSL